MRGHISIIKPLVLAPLMLGSLIWATGAHTLSLADGIQLSLLAAECDEDGDGFCRQPFGPDCDDLIPDRLLVDSLGGRLIVGCTSKPTFPIKEGDLLFYDLSRFDPDVPEAMDDHRTSHVPDESLRVSYPNIHAILLDGDDLYVADRDNGLYRYALGSQAYVGFYPAQRGPISQAYQPHRVQSPDGVVPLYHPISLALTPAGRLMVQEHVSGRVSILSRLHQVYLPLVEVQQ